jgi:TPR repeat protein
LITVIYGQTPLSESPKKTEKQESGELDLSLYEIITPSGQRADPEKRHASAQFRLGLNYLHGLSVEKNPVEAVKWFRIAAEQGDAGAQGILGVSYSSGGGLRKIP